MIREVPSYLVAMRTTPWYLGVVSDCTANTDSKTRCSWHREFWHITMRKSVRLRNPQSNVMMTIIMKLLTSSSWPSWRRSKSAICTVCSLLSNSSGCARDRREVSRGMLLTFLLLSEGLKTYLCKCHQVFQAKFERSYTLPKAMARYLMNGFHLLLKSIFSANVHCCAKDSLYLQAKDTSPHYNLKAYKLQKVNRGVTCAWTR